MSDEKEGTTVWADDGAGGDETEIVNPVLDYEQHCDTEVGPTAWSRYQPENELVREGPSWKQVSLIAAAIFVPLAAVAVMLISSWVQQQSKPPVVSEPIKVVTVPPAAANTQAPVVVPPPVTVTAPPPVTVTQAAPPPVTVAAPPVAAPPVNGAFLVCPDGHSGVATGVTSCQFAMNVRTSYLSQGGPEVIAYSPVTGQSYDMECLAGFTANLNNGRTVNAVRCVGGSDAVVILW
jgi:hypothetical protein